MEKQKSLKQPAREKRIPILLTENERDRIKAAALAAGLGASTYIRVKILELIPEET